MQTNYKNCTGVFGGIKIHLLVLILLVMGMSISACSKQPVRMPAISQIATDQYNEGKFVWYDLYTDDLTAASNFYEALLGWSFKNTSHGNQNVKTIFQENTPIANIIYTKPLKKNIKESRWLGYISVNDVDQVSNIVEKNKGKIYLSPRDMPDRGRMAVVIDPQGAIFGIMKATKGDPLDTGIIENYWMGSELWTTDLNAAVKFYTRLAGYETHKVDLKKDKENYTFLVKNNKRRAGVVKIVWKNIKPDWLPYIAVTDAVAVVNKAKQLGGRILVKPDTSVLDGLVAIISDPSGAVFGIQQLQNIENIKEQ